MWEGVLLASVGCYLTKYLGVSIPRRVLDDPRVHRAGLVLPIAALAALIGLQTFTSQQDLVLDARVAAVAVAIVATRLRAPFLVIVGLAAATAAILRAVV